jgi:5-formyltetrahydrofolate cyclo-ligase
MDVDDPDIDCAKRELREELSTARRALSAEQLDAARAAVRAHVLAAVQAGTVAAYEPLRTEPGSVQLLAALHERGIRVLVPHTLPDRDLDWMPWSPSGHGPLLGLDAVAAAELVLVPALAVARDGTRLGRGGGSYDRALRRVGPQAVTAALLFDGEVLPGLPRASWDVPVAAAVTPSGWLRLTGNPEFPSER